MSLSPRTARERRMWLAVSGLAGVSEEITWRGVQPVLIATLVHSPILAACIAAVMFGVAHIVQGWRSAFFGIMMALGFQSIVWLSGSLYLAMVVHFAYEAIAGVAIGRLAEEAHSPPSNGAPSVV